MHSWFLPAWCYFTNTILPGFQGNIHNMHVYQLLLLLRSTYLAVWKWIQTKSSSISSIDSERSFILPKGHYLWHDTYGTLFYEKWCQNTDTMLYNLLVTVVEILFLCRYLLLSLNKHIILRNIDQVVFYGVALLFSPCCFRYSFKYDSNIAHITFFYICTIWYEPCTHIFQFPSFLHACLHVSKSHHICLCPFSWWTVPLNLGKKFIVKDFNCFLF